MEGLTVSRLVHWVDPCSGDHQAAVITAVYEPQDWPADSQFCVDLFVFPTRYECEGAVRVGVGFSSKHCPGHWHWIERVH